jgi:hypothetical protein
MMLHRSEVRIERASWVVSVIDGGPLLRAASVGEHLPNSASRMPNLE